MPPSFAAAHEINMLWLNCLGHARVDLANCPSDEQVAAVIDRHCPVTQKP